MKLSHPYRIDLRKVTEFIEFASHRLVAALGGEIIVGAGVSYSIYLDIWNTSGFELGNIPVEGVSPASVVGTEVGLGSAVQARSNQIIGVVNVVV